MDEKMKSDIKAIVAEIFTDKEDVEIQRKTEAALQKSATTIEELTTTLEESSAKNEELISSVAEFETSVEDLKSELEAAKKEIVEATQKLTESESTIESMNKDRAAELRMSELEQAGVASSGKEAQTAKVKEMSDEDFASYRDELVSLREAVMAELSNSEKLEVKEEKEVIAKVEVAEEEDASDESEDVTPAVNIDPQNAISAALNMEIQPSKGMTAKYAELGKAMADQFKLE
jgi:outer membrane murein-binding lipoprotein Lpp